MLLARHLLPAWGAITASLLFVLNPLVIRISNSLQPESLMLFFYVSAVYAFLRWLDEERSPWLWLAAAATSLAILVKITAGHIIILMIFLLLLQKGFRGILQRKILVFGIIALLPGLLWYLHAHGLYLAYGNSLGVSNEYHWIGWDMIKSPLFFLRLLLRAIKIEVVNIWMPLGGLVILVSLRWFSERAVKVSIYWLTSIWLYYIVAIRTTSKIFATYYHIFSAPVAALLLGVASIHVMKSMSRSGRFRFLLGVATAFAIIIVIIRAALGLRLPLFQAGAGILVLGSFLVAVAAYFEYSQRPNQSIIKFLSLSLLSLIVLTTIMFSGLKISVDLHPDAWQERYFCAQSFRRFIPTNVLILVSGGYSRDPTGHRLAFDASYFHYWLDRKGFVIPRDALAVTSIRDYVSRGARYFVLEKAAERAAQDFVVEMKKKFSLVYECDAAYLFGLEPAS
jgi:4-amino-4-deoxy-L-arabinose transferase-like glycosyltransferase